MTGCLATCRTLFFFFGGGGGFWADGSDRVFFFGSLNGRFGRRVDFLKGMRKPNPEKTWTLQQVGAHLCSYALEYRHFSHCKAAAMAIGSDPRSAGRSAKVAGRVFSPRHGQKELF